MQQDLFNQLREGQPVFDRDGREVGTITRVHRDPPEGTMATAIGYLEVEGNLPDRTVAIHVPLTSVLEVKPDRVVVEVDPDLVAAHHMQVKPEKAPD